MTFNLDFCLGMAAGVLLQFAITLLLVVMSAGEPKSPDNEL